MENDPVLLEDDEEAKCLLRMKEFIKDSDNLLAKSVLDDEIYLLRFVRGRKYNAKYAFETLETNFRMRQEKYSELFNALRPSSVKHVFESGMLGVLKHRDSHGRKIVHFRVSEWDLEKCSADDIMIACILYAEEMALEKETQLNGVSMICDYANFTWAHAKHYSLSQMRMFINIFLFSYPTRFGQGHMLNVPRMWEMAYNIFKPFLPAKVKNRIHLSRKGHESLHENISPDILPHWLGGRISSEEAEDLELAQAIFNKEEYYANFNKF